MPDGLLIDTEIPIIIEVFGMSESDTEYHLHRQFKIDYFTSLKPHDDLWYWDTFNTSSEPSLPPFKDKVKCVLRKDDGFYTTGKSLSEEGEVYSVSCSFNPPIKTTEVKKFDSEQDIKLPEDYKAFFPLHNGARIYESVDDDGVNIGGGLHLFSLDNIKETQEVEYISEHGIPIAHLLEDCYLILDIEKLKSGDSNYLNILEFTDIKTLNLNFEIFLDHYIFRKVCRFGAGLYTQLKTTIEPGKINKRAIAN
ncbi:SMI1/KNR4 family protein [Peribacillus frigoritolerans]|uniref:SMI1/KNR4 family protein n=1 Tax=Peribacillus frigoritolerans TaxID=450367 RepID=UPI003514D41B